MSKAVIIGIDGLDPFLINKWRGVLPHFNSVYNDVSEIILKSTFPPDSICAWTSIFTGKNPAEHGLIESIDYLSSKKYANSKDKATYLKGRTFWDIAGKSGKKVCVINPFIAYPAWEVNGLMVSGPVFEGGETSAYPASFLNEYNFPSLGGIVDFPEKKNLKEFIDRAKDLTEQLADVSLRIYKDHDFDLFFVTFLTLDRIKHFLWRFTDKDDMYYPGENSFQETIKEFYLLFDKIIGGYRELLAKDTSLVVISDHGHRRRCSKCLNLNEVLRANGYLSTSGRGMNRALKRLLEKTKVFTIAALSKFDLQDMIYKIAKFIPNRKALKKSTYLIDKNRSSVTLSNLCGTNPFGGFDINASTTEEYENLRNRVIRDMMNLNEINKKNIVKWARKREDLYEGGHDKKLPDVLFELNEEYGVGMDLFTSFITENYTHKKISGGHKREAVLLVYSDNDNLKNIQRPDSVIGMKDYILKLIAN